MGEKLAAAAEGAGLYLGYWICALSGIAWAGIALTKWVIHSEPLLYHYYPELSVETYPILWIAGVLAFGTIYCAMKSSVTGRPHAAIVVSWLAPRIFFFSSIALSLWVLATPAPAASYVPLAGLVGFSLWCWYASAWGFLSDRKEQASDRDALMQSVGETPEPSSGRISRPLLSFASISGHENVKARLKDAARAIVAAGNDQRSPRNGILLHGEPGNGKTLVAEALAGELRLPLVTLTYAGVASHWVGQKSTRIRAAFEQARREQPCVLFIDEIDSFLESRDGHLNGTKEDRDVVNALLTLLVDIRQCRVILIAATNHLDCLDSAGIREGRFDFKVEITPPDLPARIGLLRKGLADNLPRQRVDDSVIQLVAQRWNGFSVKRILAVTEELPAYLKATGARQVGFDELMGALRQLQGQRGAVPENVTPLDELVFSAATREMLQLIAARMSDPAHTEQHGGTLPTGVLFFGPPGTGKTAACKALAHAIGWAFLPATGAELARDPDRLEALYTKAKDLRPTVIFIDEADELLRDRQFSASTAATNKLLTILDGVGDRVRDVVWIAATNHPEQIDPALLRGGRFSEKVVFDLPSASDLALYLRRWLDRKGVALEPGLAVEQISSLIGESSIANAEAILQAAVNRAVARRETPMRVRLHDIERAVDSVHGTS